MIKTLHGMHKRPDMSIEDLHVNWFEKHGPIVATAPRMMRYVQNITLPGSYEGTPASTHDGASMTWFESVEDLWDSMDSGGWEVQRVDAPNWFARNVEATFSVARERVVVDGVSTSVQTKAIFMVSKAPHLSLEEFQSRWFDEHGRIGAALPGVRRYVQNHALPEAYGHEGRPLTRDGWSEMWFDNLEELRNAFAIEGARQLFDDDSLFDNARTGIVIARERPVVLEPRY